MDEFGSILNLDAGVQQALRIYGLLVGATLLVSVLSKSRVMALSGAIISTGWLVSVLIYLTLRDNGGPALALQGITVAFVFYWIWRGAAEHNAWIFRHLFWIHAAYGVAAGYRLFGELFFPDTMIAQYYLQMWLQNRLFDIALLYLFTVSVARIWLTRERYFQPKPRKTHEHKIRSNAGPVWLRNFFIRISNADKPDDEHIPLTPETPKESASLKRQPVSKE